MSACTEPRTGIGAVCVEYGRPKWPITMLNHTHTVMLYGRMFYFWHPMLVRPAMKRLFFPWKTKEKKARFARAPHDKVGVEEFVRAPTRFVRSGKSRISTKIDRTGQGESMVER